MVNNENNEEIKKLLEEKEKIIKVIKENKKEKNDIETKIKKITKKKYNANGLIRVSKKFDIIIESIQKKRMENGQDEIPLFKPKITELIIRHELFPKIKMDIINYNFNIEKERGEFLNVAIQK